MKSVFQMTTRELRAYIKELTPEVNERYKSYKEALTAGAMTDKPILEERHSRLVDLGTGKETKRGVGLGLTYKNKPELIQQARALEEFIALDVWSPAAQAEEETETKKAYESFKQSYLLKTETATTLNYEEYKDLTEVFGALGSHIVDEFGAYNITKLYEEEDESQRRNLVHDINEIKKESKGAGWTKEDLIDALREKLDL